MQSTIATPSRSRSDALGLQLIIAYKTAKGAGELALAVALAILAARGLAETLQDFAISMRLHVTREWSVKLAEILLVESTPKHLEVAAVALGLDGVLTFAEGWGLHLRKPWAPWLVVLASGLLLPFEVASLRRGIKPGRAILFVINLAIVAYMARRVLEDRRHASS